MLEYRRAAYTTMTPRKIGLSSLSLIQIKLDYTLVQLEVRTRANDLLPNLDASYDAARLYYVAVMIYCGQHVTLNLWLLISLIPSRLLRRIRCVRVN